MKLGVITVPLYDKSLDEALGYLKNLGKEKAIKFLSDIIIREDKPSSMFWA